MTDTFAVQGDFAPAESLAALETEGLTLPEAPNGFLKLDLAPELLQAVADLGFTQPTPVQEQVIPRALPSGDDAGFIDLIVSSQTGSGKTAAFLLPVLHTLLKQREEADA